MSLIESDSAWEELGRSDPYYGVLADPRFRAAHRDGPEREEFFASGRDHVERCFALLEAAGGGQPRRWRRALDYGCGVGRLVIPLAARCDQVVGADISHAMLAEARRNCGEAGVENVSFVHAEELLAGSGERFDLVHSYIVFQHMPPRRGEAVLRALLERLEEGGAAILHFTYASGRPLLRRLVLRLRSRVSAIHRLLNLLQGRPARAPLIQMNVYDLDRLFRILHTQGCHDVQVRFTDHGGFYGVVLFVRKTTLPSY